MGLFSEKNDLELPVTLYSQESKVTRANDKISSYTFRF